MSREFAPGIPAGRVIKSIPKVSPKASNQDWDVSLSMHPAAVRGDHFDLRLVDPKGKAHSWAMAKLPDPGQSTYAAQQATHSKSYALRKKPWKIPPGYGATRPGKMVEPVYVQKAEMVQAGNEKIRFLRHHGQETDEFVLRRVGEKGGQPLWALNNATKNRRTREGAKLPSSKPQYKEIKPEQVAFSDVGEVMTPKLDGAHVLVDMKGPNAPMRVYSYRPTERRTGIIEHTFKFPDFHRRMTSPSTKNTLLRAELWASKDGKAIPAEQLGGLLNSSVLKSRAKQQEGNIKLRLTGIDVVKHKGKNYENKDFNQKMKALRTITRGSRGAIEMPPIARTSEEKQRLLDDIKQGRMPETKEGVVIHRVDKPAPPTKVKFKNQDDVYVREIFTKDRGKARGHSGGFAYSLDPDGPIVGRVGTGFNHKTRKDMLENPDKYVGRVAKVQSQGPYSSGALRAPSFDEWHIDKTPPELMKEGEDRWYFHGAPRSEKIRKSIIAKGLVPKETAKHNMGYTGPIRGSLIEHTDEQKSSVHLADNPAYAANFGRFDEGGNFEYTDPHMYGVYLPDDAVREKSKEISAATGRIVPSRAFLHKGVIPKGKVKKIIADKRGVLHYGPIDSEDLTKFKSTGLQSDRLAHRPVRKFIEGMATPLPYTADLMSFKAREALGLPIKTAPRLMKEGAGRVYHYGPKDVDLSAVGLGTPATLRDPAAEKYKQRASEDLGREASTEDVINWLEETRGPGGSRMGSVIHEPIGKHSTPEQQAYAGRRQLYGIDYDRAVREGAIEGAHVVEESPMSKRPVRRRDLLSELGKAKGFEPDNRRLVFQGAPHGFITIKDGTLPGKYLKKEGASELYHGSPQDMFKEEEEAVLKKESQEDVLGEVKKYKERAVEEMTPDRIINIARLSHKPTRSGAAANLGLTFARDHLDEKYPGMVEDHINKVRRETGGKINRAADLTRDWRK